MLHVILAAALAAAPGPRPATNTTCPVGGAPVDAKSIIVVVRGQAYRVCCKDGAAKLKAQPDQYLKKDGTPKNAK
jgi:hypothetical protein